jgi:PAS domain-containing protein
MGKSLTFIVVILAVFIGWIQYLSSLATDSERDMELLALHADLNDATIKTFATNAAATDRGVQQAHKDLKEATGKYELAATVLSGVEKKRNALLGAKPQNRTRQFQAFEKENSTLTRVLKNYVLTDVRALRDGAVAGAVLSAISLASVVTMLLRKQSASGRTRIASTSQEKLTQVESTLLVHLRAVVFQIDDNLLIKKTGASTSALLGYAADELFATPLTDLIKFPEDQFKVLLAAARDTKAEQSVQCEMYNKSGQMLLVQLTVLCTGPRNYACLAVDIG